MSGQFSPEGDDVNGLKYGVNENWAASSFVTHCIAALLSFSLGKRNNSLPYYKVMNLSSNDRHPEPSFQWKAVRRLERDEPDGQGVRPEHLERAGNDTAKRERGNGGRWRRRRSASQPASKRLISLTFYYFFRVR